MDGAAEQAAGRGTAAPQGHRYAHLQVDVRPVAALPDEDRIAHIRTERWIRHPAAERVLGYLQEAFDQGPRRRMENVLLLGESGMGKSMLLEKFERRNSLPFDEASGAQPRPARVQLLRRRRANSRRCSPASGARTVHWCAGRRRRGVPSSGRWCWACSMARTSDSSSIWSVSGSVPKRPSGSGRRPPRHAATPPGCASSTGRPRPTSGGYGPSGHGEPHWHGFGANMRTSVVER